jgi:hypothetical protein
MRVRETNEKQISHFVSKRQKSFSKEGISWVLAYFLVACWPLMRRSLVPQGKRIGWIKEFILLMDTGLPNLLLRLNSPLNAFRCAQTKPQVSFKESQEFVKEF